MRSIVIVTAIMFILGGEAHAASAPQIVSACYAFGTTCKPISSGSPIDYASPLLLTLAQPLRPKDVVAGIQPAAKLLVSAPAGPNVISIRWHRALGTTYRLSINGAPFTVVTPASVTIPKRSYANDKSLFYGMMLHTWTFRSNYRDTVLTKAAQAGVQFVRIDYSGRALWPGTKGSLRGNNAKWAVEDDIASRIQGAGMTELPTCLQYGVPSWEAPANTIWRSPADYAAYCGLVATHLRTQHPAITRIELMNEPNQAYWWTGTDDGTSTAAYLKAAYAAVKKANPHLTIVGPALASGGPQHQNLGAFLQKLYDSGCRTGVCWDVLSVHVYPWATDPSAPQPPNAEGQFANYKVALKVADANSDRSARVMVTEFAYSTDPGPFGVDPFVQAYFTALAMNAYGSDPRVDGFVWSDLYDGEDHGPLYGTDGLASFSGGAFVPKPAYVVYKRFATAASSP